MKKVILFFLVLSAVNASAQNAQQDINAQVWKPFIQSFNDRDTKGFMAVHSKDVVRSPRDSRKVWNYDEYYKQQERGDQNEKASGAKRQLELRFTERIANKDLAIEVGIYKTTMTRSNGVTASYYGRFHVVLRKENGIWKILVDTDYSENNSIDEKDFLEAQPLE
jgi:ketosteroid isomerase-like protein